MGLASCDCLHHQPGPGTKADVPKASRRRAQCPLDTAQRGNACKADREAGAPACGPNGISTATAALTLQACLQGIAFS